MNGGESADSHWGRLSHLLATQNIQLRKPSLFSVGSRSHGSKVPVGGTLRVFPGQTPPCILCCSSSLKGLE